MPVMSVEEAKELLTNLPQNAIVEIKVSAEGHKTLSVSQPKTKQDILQEKYGHLLDKKITLTQAAKKYQIPRSTIQSWLFRSKYLKAVDPNAHPLFLIEADIAYLVEIYKERREIGSRAPLLDEDGLPYQIKHPELVAYRQKIKGQ